MPFESHQLYLYIFVFLLALGKGGHKKINLLGHLKLKHFISENLKQYFSSSLKKHQCLLCCMGGVTVQAHYSDMLLPRLVCAKSTYCKKPKKPPKPHNTPPIPREARLYGFMGASPPLNNV